MKLIIEIPEEQYNDIVKYLTNNDGNYAYSDFNLREIIRNGTPYNPSGDAISREALKDIAYINKGNFNTIEGIREWIDNAQAIPLPNEQTAWEQGYETGLAQGKNDRPKGEWRNVVHGVLAYKACNKCNAEYPFDLTEDWILCPRCGAKIKGGAE